MKFIAILLFVISIGICYGDDFPADVPTEIFGLVITSSINLNIRHDIDINHPAITALPHYNYLVEPIAIGLSGTGLADIVVANNLVYPFVSAYYGSAWHKANPYIELPFDDMFLEQVDFEAGSEVILLVCRNDPFMQVIFESFTAVYDEAVPNTVTVSWTTASETGLSSFRLFFGTSNNPDQSAYIQLVPATNTVQPHTYTFVANGISTGYTYYYWLKLMDNLNQGYYYGPVSVAVGPPYVPQNKVYSVVPNPCDNEFWCAFGLQDSSLVSIVLLDANNNV
ncbi:MAG: hypothetical protein PHO32_05955, partial [Candidatus Cloacimonetes bacterium]|nr:hypothetical protein [Candidatus Cloacimonadota bacterium]